MTDAEDEISVDEAEFEFFLVFTEASEDQLKEASYEPGLRGLPPDPHMSGVSSEHIPMHWEGEIRRLLEDVPLMWDEGVMWVSPSEGADELVADQAPLILKHLCSMLRDLEEVKIWPEHIPRYFRHLRIDPDLEVKFASGDVPGASSLHEVKQALEAHSKAFEVLKDAARRLPRGHERWAAIEACLEGGMRKTEVARLLGVSPQRVTQMLADANRGAEDVERRGTF